ncbi:MAG: trypsin-like peptidase domain-containing protein [Pseudomonadota bacterium]
MGKRLVVLLLALFWASVATAQSWVQIEAQPNEASALQRAQIYAARLADVNAFRTGTNWHVIAIGPFASEDDAAVKLFELRAARAVPADSFVSDGQSFRGRIFGTGVAAAPVAAPAPVLVPGEETVAQARASERGLTRDERELLQTALKFEGFYNSVIDASFGPGTRRAMSAWQRANGFEETGILTTLQRQDLINGYLEVQASLGTAPYADEKAGIEVDLPLGMVRFDRYEAPFVHFASAENPDMTLVLISQTGGEDTLTALFDIMQTLEIAPIGAEARRGRQSFTIEGQDSRVLSHIFARRAGDTVKGFALTWPVDDARRYRAVLSSMQASFRTSDSVLPDTAGGGAQDIDLLSGLDIRRPETTRSGFYIDSDGLVVTTADAVAECTRITIDGDIDAEVMATGSGFALLRPTQTLAPLSIARLATVQPRIQSDIAVSGYSFGGLLSAPTLSFGTLADVKGLDGNQDVERLAVAIEPGDAGGPVLDVAGVVVGMVLPAEESTRQLPEDVAFAADAPLLSSFLVENGVTPAAGVSEEVLPPEDLTLLATDLTVLVSCWN